jgi:hypothetical protein
MIADQRKIIEALRHGPLNQYEIAREVDLAPFAVRGELLALKREKIVRIRFRTRDKAWELTEHGYELAWVPHQLRIVR